MRSIEGRQGDGYDNNDNNDSQVGQRLGMYCKQTSSVIAPRFYQVLMKQALLGMYVCVCFGLRRDGGENETFELDVLNAEVKSE